MKNQEEFIFRYRPTKSFNKYNELQNQEIYFGALGELNDPMEGYKNIFWKGDKILWRNLLKRYIRCLQKFFCKEEKDEYSFKEYKYLAYLSDQDFTTESFNKICEIFFAIPSVEKFLTLLEQQENMFREELIFCLEFLHQQLLKIINFITLGDHKITQDMLNEMDSTVTKLNEYLSLKLSEEYKKIFKKIQIEKFLKSADSLHFTFMIVNAELIQTITEHLKYKKDLSIGFPKHYIDSLEELMYPEYYIASFTKDCTNPSMWSHYAENHQGICLKFKPAVLNNQLSMPNI